MAQPVIFRLISCLSDAEKKILRQRIADSGRKPLRNLSDLVLKTSIKEEPDKELIFYKTFAKKYTEKQDGILRNEYANLKKIVEEVMAETQRNNELSQSNSLNDVSYLTRLSAATEDFDLFDLEAEKIVTAAKTRYDYDCLAKVYLLYIKMLTARAWNQVKMMNKLDEYIARHKDICFKQYLLAHRQNAEKYFVSERIKLGAQKIFEYTDIADAAMVQYEDTCTRYWHYNVVAITSWGRDQIDALTECDRLLNLMPQLPYYANDKFKLLSRLAMSYKMMGQHEVSLNYYQELAAYIPSRTKRVQAEYYYNHASNLISLSRYHEALEILGTHEELISSMDTMREKLIHSLAMAYSYLKEGEKLFDILPKNFADVSKVMEMEFRFLISISYYLTRDYETATRDAGNLYKTIITAKKDGSYQYYDSIETGLKQLIRFFTVYRDFSINKDRKTLRAKLKKILEEAYELKKSDPDNYSVHYHQWMIKQIEEELTV